MIAFKIIITNPRQFGKHHHQLKGKGNVGRNESEMKNFDKPSPEVIKRFFMLNSDEHEICPPDKSQITNNCKFFLATQS